MKTKTVVIVSLVVAVVLLLAAGSVGATPPLDEPAPQVIDSGDEPSGDGQVLGMGLSAAVSPLLQYQARLADPATGDPVADGTYNMSFSLYETETGGTALWSESKAVGAANGLLSTALGDTTTLDLNLFHGQALWLGITVAGEELSPRQPILPVAYAMSLVPGAVVAGDTSSAVLVASNTGSTSHGLLGATASTSPGKAGVLGVAGSTSLTPNQEVGVFGKSSDGMGVAGMSSTEMGVYGYSASSYGVRGEGMGSYAGVFGGNWGDAPGAPGVEGYSSQSYGVYGQGGTGSGDYGGYFTSGYGGVYAYGDNYGVYARAQTIGVYGYAEGATGTTYGVYGRSASPDGYAGYFSGDARVTGDLTVGRVTYSSPRTHYLALPSEAFHPTTNVNYSNYRGGYIGTGSTASGTLVAPVHLPHLAVITEFKVFFNDTSTADLTVYLCRHRFSDANYPIMALVSSSGTSGYQSSTDTTILYATVDNTSHGYVVYANSSSWASSLRIHGAVVKYTIAEAP